MPLKDYPIILHDSLFTKDYQYYPSTKEESTAYAVAMDLREKGMELILWRATEEVNMQRTRYTIEVQVNPDLLIKDFCKIIEEELEIDCLSDLRYDNGSKIATIEYYLYY